METCSVESSVKVLRFIDQVPRYVPLHVITLENPLHKTIYVEQLSHADVVFEPELRRSGQTLKVSAHHRNIGSSSQTLNTCWDDCSLINANMTPSTRPTSNAFVRTMRKLYNPIGFSKGYNATLWFIFGGALVGFTLARFQYLNFDIFCGNEGSSHAGPGECFNYQTGHEKVGIILHLATILPASILAVLQFIPVLRHKAILFHRLNGYACVVLGLLSTAGVLMIARNAYGGEISTQLGVGFLSIIFVGSLVMAYINIKRLQIEQHRAWMLRAWFYVSTRG